MSLSGILPSEWPLVVVRQISEYASITYQELSEDINVGKMVRINLNGSLHDTFIIEELPPQSNRKMTEDDPSACCATTVLLFSCGAALRVPRSNHKNRNSDIEPFTYGLTWEVPPDTNPASLRCMDSRWFTSHVNRPGDAAIMKIDIMTISDEVNLRSDTVYGLRGAVSHHRRVRLFQDGETRRHPTRRPHILYCKISPPYLALYCQRPTDGYMREASAYRLLHHCRVPQVAPVCYYSHFHPVTGSYAVVLESLDVYVQYRGTVVETYPKTKANFDGGDGKLISSVRDTLSDAIKVIRALASLHGTFLSPPEKSALDVSDEEDAPPHGMLTAKRSPNKSFVHKNRRLLREHMLHERVFAERWCAMLHDDELKVAVRTLYSTCRLDPVKQPRSVKTGSESRADSSAVTRTCAVNHQANETHRAAAIMKQNLSYHPQPNPWHSLQQHGSSEPSLLVRDINKVVSTDEAIDVEQFTDSDFVTSVDAKGSRSRITLIHGRLCSQHILVHPDPRHVPGALLLDWKYCGLGPLEVDLVQLYLSLPVRKYRIAWLPTLLREYCEHLNIAFHIFDITPLQLLCCMRDVCLLLASSDGFEWNGNATWCEYIIPAHEELLYMTSDRNFLLKNNFLDE